MKNGQLALSKSFGLLRIDQIKSDTCVYCTILTGSMKGGITVEYKENICPIEETETLIVI